MSATLDAVVFDLDGTLHDHNGSVTAALRTWLPALGADVDDGLIVSWFEIEELHFPQWSAGKITYQDQRRLRLIDFLPLIHVTPGPSKELDALYDGYLEHYEASWMAYGDVAQALETVEAAGLRIAILTNGTATQQRAKVAAIGLADRIDFILTSEEIGVGKPEPRAYLAVSQRLGVHPSRALHIGDRYDLDVLGARAAGFDAAHLDRPGSGPSGEPRRMRSLVEIDRFIE